MELQEDPNENHTYEDAYQLTENMAPTIHEVVRTIDRNPENSSEDVNYIGNKGGNSYSNTYNPSWRDQPNLKWGGNQGRGNNSNQNRQNIAYQLLICTGKGQSY
ncbi:hypothetical protein EPI10_005407 [Gossypium australe]|uniref:Uncharacterized protein n=1 Tax=Gossypium australe TaxID=47621 RepID=A0A5B6WPM4_9ROSI|nr:hypothetical protein EPI10_005407 [Gossypium australe]